MPRIQRFFKTIGGQLNTTTTCIVMYFGTISKSACHSHRQSHFILIISFGIRPKVDWCTNSSHQKKNTITITSHNQSNEHNLVRLSQPIAQFYYTGNSQPRSLPTTLNIRDVKKPIIMGNGLKCEIVCSFILVMPHISTNN